MRAEYSAEGLWPRKVTLEAQCDVEDATLRCCFCFHNQWTPRLNPRLYDFFTRNQQNRIYKLKQIACGALALVEETKCWRVHFFLSLRAHRFYSEVEGLRQRNR